MDADLVIDRLGHLELAQKRLGLVHHAAGIRLAIVEVQRLAAAPCPLCQRKEPRAGGCSHVDCPHRKQLTAAPKRQGDGLIPPRGSDTRH